MKNLNNTFTPPGVLPAVEYYKCGLTAGEYYKVSLDLFLDRDELNTCSTFLLFGLHVLCCLETLVQQSETAVVAPAATTAVAKLMVTFLFTISPQCSAKARPIQQSVPRRVVLLLYRIT